MDIGIWGMGRMGFNMARRLVDRGDHRVIAGNRSSGKVDDAVEQGAEGAYTVQEFVEKQGTPRVLWSMLPAGEVTDEMIDHLIELADEGDIIVDGANSYFRDSIRRAEKVRGAGLKWLDAGVSGGIWGYDVGYCTMVGGDADAFEYAEPIFKTLAPENGYAYLGDAGAGHFAKMVHNGVEYGMLQAYAEGSRSCRSPATPTTSAPSAACGTRGASCGAGSSSSPRGPSRRTRTWIASGATSRTRARVAGRCSRPYRRTCRRTSSRARSSPASPPGRTTRSR
jgi:6-phosphogluconate dehydrogenase